MYTTEELSDYLKREGAEFEMIRQETPILSTRDAEKYFDTALAAPALILQSETGLMLLIASARRRQLMYAENCPQGCKKAE